MSEKHHKYAFPGADPWEEVEPGMTLRDYFAAKAVAGIFYPAIVESLAQDIDLDCDKIAGFAYTMADAMLAEREK